MILYRPVGTKELKLIEESNYSKFPPRLPEQPIFYPVLTEEYAVEIASGWNAKYNDDHKELWIPAERIEEFNLHTVIRLPESCFAPYTNITTNLLFFNNNVLFSMHHHGKDFSPVCLVYYAILLT